MYINLLSYVSWIVVLFIGNKNLLDGEIKQLAKFYVGLIECGQIYEGWPNRGVENPTIDLLPYSYFSFEPGMTWNDFLTSSYNSNINDINKQYDYCSAINRNDSLICDNVPWTIYNTEDYIQYENASYAGVLCLRNYDEPVALNEPIVVNGVYYASYCCFSFDSLITLSSYTTKLAKDIDYNDSLLVWDFDNGCFAQAKPLWISKIQRATQYYKLTFDDGTILKLVGSNGKSHRAFNVENCEFTYGNYFHVGQHSFKQDQTNPQLVSIELIDEPIEYINIITNYHMNLFANGILTSCGYNNMYPIKAMKFVKDDRQTITFDQYKNIPIEYYDGLRLCEQDLGKRSIEKADCYINKLIALAK